MASSFATNEAFADNVYIFGDRPGDIAGLNATLTGLGHTVTTTANLPANIATFDTIWYVGATNSISAPDIAAVTTFIQAGGGVHITGERPCCEALNTQVESIVNTVISVGGVVVGGLGDKSAPHTFNPTARNGITTSPNAITTWTPAASGGMGGLAGENILVTSSDGTPTGGVWGPQDMANGVGCLTVLMDVNWFSGDPDIVNIVDNIQTFHNICAPPSVCGDGVIEGLETCDDGNADANDGCSDTCTLETGYTCPTPGRLCIDDDECVLGTDNCDANAACTNTPGSFTCACNAGYSGNGVMCIDDDECALGTDNCDANAAL